MINLKMTEEGKSKDYGIPKSMNQKLTKEFAPNAYVKMNGGLRLSKPVS
jgi:hypothetical protein